MESKGGGRTSGEMGRLRNGVNFGTTGAQDAASSEVKYYWVGQAVTTDQAYRTACYLHQMSWNCDLWL